MHVNHNLLWPKPRYKVKNFFQNASSSQVEEKLQAMFPNTYPVFFSSGRACIVAALEYYGIERPNFVAYPPFSSHCVLEAVARCGSPVLHSRQEFSAVIVFHQWGFTKIIEKQPKILEDSADSLFVPGPIHFPNNGCLQLVSLPKVIGSSGGGVLFCRNSAIAVQLKQIRARTHSSYNFQYLMRILGLYNRLAYSYWAAAETLMGCPSRYLCGEVLELLNNWAEIVTDRRAKWDLLQRVVKPNWELSADRLPCVVPLPNQAKSHTILEKLGLYEGVRHFIYFNQGKWGMKKVIPVPIHQDIKLGLLELLVEEISNI